MVRIQSTHQAKPWGCRRRSMIQLRPASASGPSSSRSHSPVVVILLNKIQTSQSGTPTLLKFKTSSERNHGNSTITASRR